MSMTWRWGPAAPAFSNITVSNISATAAAISWDADPGATGQVAYGTTAGYGSLTTLETSFLTFHEQSVTGLTAGTTYHYAIMGTGADGQASTSSDQTFDTTAAGSPAISNVVVSAITETGATIAFDVSPTCTALVDYGTTLFYDAATAEAATDTSHSFALTGLIGATPYHYRIKVTTAGLDVTHSADATFTTSSGAGTFPASRTTLAAVATPSFAKPGYLVPYTDPTWGTQVMRITNTNFWRHVYSSNQIWNCDNTLISMYGSVRRILNATTYADLGAGGQPGTGRWSKTVPNRMYGTSTGGNLNCLVSRDYPSWSDTVLYRWTNETEVTMGEGEGVPSEDDRYWPIQGKATGNCYVFDKTGGTSSLTRQFAPSIIDNSTISSLGNYHIIMFVDDGPALGVGTWLFDRATGATIREISTRSAHGDVGLDADGREVFVMSSGTNVRLFDLADPTRDRDLFPSGYAFSSCHVSCRAYGRPGWAYISVFRHQPGVPGNDTMTAVAMDGSFRMEVFAHQQNIWQTQGSANDDYRSEPQGTVNVDGSKVIFASEWTDGGEVNAYVAGMVL